MISIYLGKRNASFWNRNSIRSVLLVSALAIVSLTAQSAPLSGWKAAPYSQSGTRTSFGLGNSSSQITPPPGYQYAGNYGVPNTAVPGTTFALSADGKVFIPNRAGYSDGVMYPYRYEAKMNWGDLAGTVAGFIGGPLGVACALACPLLTGALDRADLRYSPDDPKVIEQRTKGDSIPGGQEYRWTSLESWGTAEGSCKAYLARISANDPVSNKVFVQVRTAQYHSDWACVYDEYSKETGRKTYGGAERTGVENRTGDNTFTDKWAPATIEQIRAAMDKSFPVGGVAPGTIRELLDKGADIPLPKPENITITGPTSIPGPSTTTTNSDGSRTVETTSRNFTTGAPGASNVINNTTNTTTTTTYNIDNSVRSTSTSTQTPVQTDTDKKEEEEEECKEGSTKLSCAEMDVPEGKIPKETKNVTFTPEEGFLGTGRCPADVAMSFRTNGISSATIVNWTSFCEMAIPLRAVILSMAAIMAFFIVMPGGRVE